MKRLPLILSIAVLPLTALAAEPSVAPGGAPATEWVWCHADAMGRVGAGAPERAELSISGTTVSGRLLVDNKEYARLEGVISPASVNTGVDGATTRVWQITATETMLVGGRPAQKLVLEGAYTKYQSADAASGPSNRSYEVLALSKADGKDAAVIISRVEPPALLRVAER
ncbi:MAG TPA: hypothetical protein VE397_04735 [Stellaceae bacterium]|nr:hypothetical protein [Stellaceae bacterium]